MTRHLFSAALVAMVLAPAAAHAQSRQELLVQSDMRVLQEQVGRLQLAVNQLSEQLKAVNSRIDQAAEANTKTFANQQNLINQIATQATTIREKLDDNTVRVSQLTQEFSAVRDGLRLLTDTLNSLMSLLQPTTAPATDGAPAAGGASAAAGPIAPVNLPSSPNSMYSSARGHYLSGRYDIAIEAFQDFLKTYADSPLAASAQLHIGESYYQLKRCQQAIPEYQKVVNNYRTTEAVPDALMMLGMCYSDIKRPADAQRAYEQLIKQYPQSNQALQAAQRLETLTGARR